MADAVLEMVRSIQNAANHFIGQALKENKIDSYSMEYNEETQCWTIEVSFNEGDAREIKIKLDVNPDE